MKKLKLLSLVLAMLMVVSFALTACTPSGSTSEKESTSSSESVVPGESETTSEPESKDPMDDLWEYSEAVAGQYTYQDSVSTMASNWNPHVYETADDSYPLDFITAGLYSFVFNDEAVNPSTKGKDPFTGYEIVPEMAAALPVDVTAQYAVEGNIYGLSTEITEGFAYKIALNPNAKWQDGTPINADTYVYSMEKLFNPELQNYRSIDYTDGDLSIANAQKYLYQGKVLYPSAGQKYNAISASVAAEDTWLEFDLVNSTFLNEWFGGTYAQVKGVADYWAYFNIYAGEGEDRQPTGENFFDKYFGNNAESGARVLVTAEMIEDYANMDAWNPAPETELLALCSNKLAYEDDYDFSNVGILKTGEYEITLILGKQLKGFYLLYNLSGNWIVYEDLYEEDGYNTSVATTMSYGPYKLVEFQTAKFMRFERNENWYGYTDGKHKYQDPVDGEIYDMYQTSAIECRVVKESSTNKMMFFKGLLMGYGLQAEDFDEYRNSDYAYASPATTTFFFVFNGNLNAMEQRESNEGFDRAKYDLQTMSLKAFKQAIAVTYDKDLFASTVSPARSAGFGLIGSTYVYDVDSGAKYRDTDQAKQALCEFYSVDVSKYDSLDEAVASITGYNPDAAKALFTQAFEESLEKGYITDADNDGKSDQEIKIEYCSSSAGGSFIKMTLDYLNAKLAEVLVGTPFEGKIYFYESASYGNDWSKKLKAGMSDTCLCGWQGSALNPFGLTDLYVNPDSSYDAGWFDASKEFMTLTIDGEELTMSLTAWSDALNGEIVTVDGKDYCFGDGVASVETRLTILAAFENAILQTYNYIPMLEDGSMALLSKQVYYVIEEYHPVMGRGGIAYMRYNFDDAEWADYIEECGGTLAY